MQPLSIRIPVAHKHNIAAKADGKSKRATVEDASDDDEDYVPPKRSCKEPNSPSRVFNSDGNEDEELTEAGIQLVLTLSPLFTIEFLTKSYCCLECKEERKGGEKACCQGKGAEAKSKEKGKIGASKWARNDQQQFFRRRLE